MDCRLSSFTAALARREMSHGNDGNNCSFLIFGYYRGVSTMQHYFFKRYLSPGDEIRAIFHRHFLVALPNIFFWLALPIGAVSW